MRPSQDRREDKAGPLAGLCVLDLTRYLPGAVTTLWLARYGAEVIKVEPPGAGEPGRERPRLFAATNGGKKSLALNLKSAAGREAFLRLAGGADVVVESFRPGVMRRLGVDYAALRNPRLVYASLTGYPGRGGRMAGHDINYCAESGLLDLLVPEGLVTPELAVADIAGGSFPLLAGILLALVERAATGRGRALSVSITGGLASLLAWPRTVEGDGRLLGGNYACYGLYPTRDGRRLAVGALEPKFWANLCRALGCEAFEEQQFTPSRQRAMRRRLEAIFRTRTLRQWEQRLQDTEVCVSPVRRLDEAQRGAPLGGLGLVLANGVRGRLARAPRVGEHSAEILARVEARGVGAAL